PSDNRSDTRRWGSAGDGLEPAGDARPLEERVVEEPRRERVSDQDYFRDAPLESGVEPVDGAPAVGEDDRVDAVERERPVGILVDRAHTKLAGPVGFDGRERRVDEHLHVTLVEPLVERLLRRA